jgi:hypothetical protein
MLDTLAPVRVRVKADVPRIRQPENLLKMRDFLICLARRDSGFCFDLTCCVLLAHSYFDPCDCSSAVRNMHEAFSQRCFNFYSGWIIPVAYQGDKLLHKKTGAVRAPVLFTPHFTGQSEIKFRREQQRAGRGVGDVRSLLNPIAAAEQILDIRAQDHVLADHAHAITHAEVVARP